LRLDILYIFYISRLLPTSCAAPGTTIYIYIYIATLLYTIDNFCTIFFLEVLERRRRGGAKTSSKT